MRTTRVLLAASLTLSQIGYAQKSQAPRVNPNLGFAKGLLNPLVSSVGLTKKNVPIMDLYFAVRPMMNPKGHDEWDRYVFKNANAYLPKGSIASDVEEWGTKHTVLFETGDKPLKLEFFEFSPDRADESVVKINGVILRVEDFVEYRAHAILKAIAEGKSQREVASAVDDAKKNIPAPEVFAPNSKLRGFSDNALTAYLITAQKLVVTMEKLHNLSAQTRTPKKSGARGGKKVSAIDLLFLNRCGFASGMPNDPSCFFAGFAVEGGVDGSGQGQFCSLAKTRAMLERDPTLKALQNSCTTQNSILCNPRAFGLAGERRPFCFTPTAPSTPEAYNVATSSCRAAVDAWLTNIQNKQNWLTATKDYLSETGDDRALINRLNAEVARLKGECQSFLNATGIVGTNLERDQQQTCAALRDYSEDLVQAATPTPAPTPPDDTTPSPIDRASDWITRNSDILIPVGILTAFGALIAYSISRKRSKAPSDPVDPVLPPVDPVPPTPWEPEPFPPYIPTPVPPSELPEGVRDRPTDGTGPRRVVPSPSSGGVL